MTLQSREMSMKNCMRCSNCRWLPSINHGEFGHICPSIRYGKFHSYTGGGKIITGFGLLHEAVDYDKPMLDTIYACSACGGCDVACAANLNDLVEPMEGIYALRQRVVEVVLDALDEILVRSHDPCSSIFMRSLRARNSRTFRVLTSVPVISATSIRGSPSK